MIFNTRKARKQGRRGRGGRGVVAGGRGPWPPQLFRNRRIFENFNASSEHFLTFAVGIENSVKFYRKIIELGPTYSTGATTPLRGS